MGVPFDLNLIMANVHKSIYFWYGNESDTSIYQNCWFLDGEKWYQKQNKTKQNKQKNTFFFAQTFLEGLKNKISVGWTFRFCLSNTIFWKILTGKGQKLFFVQKSLFLVCFGHFLIDVFHARSINEWHQYLSIQGLLFWFAWMNHCTIQWLFATIWNVVGALKARALCRTNHDVHAHRRAKNNRNCHDACAHLRALTSPVSPSIAELFNVYQPWAAFEPVSWSPCRSSVINL